MVLAGDGVCSRGCLLLLHSPCLKDTLCEKKDLEEALWEEAFKQLYAMRHLVTMTVRLFSSVSSTEVHRHLVLLRIPSSWTQSPEQEDWTEVNVARDQAAWGGPHSPAPPGRAPRGSEHAKNIRLHRKVSANVSSS